MSSAVLLASVETEGAAAAIRLASSENPAEVLQALSVLEIERLWQALTPVTAAALDAAEPAMQGGKPQPTSDGASDDATESAISTLHAVTILAHACISNFQQHAPAEL